MSLSSFLKYAAIGATLSLLAGCTTPAPVTANVILPPSPRVGTGPIAAYDKYAFALFSSATAKETVAAQNSQSAPKPKGPAVAVNSN